MKKLVIFCLIVLLIGGGLAAGGLAAGGELYGTYYNGALHPVRETLHDADRWWHGGVHWREWVDIDGEYHAGWFEDVPADGHPLDGLDPLAAFPTVRDSEPVSELDIRLTGGAYRIVEGEQFSIAGAASLRTNELSDGEWKLRAEAQSEQQEVMITLPAEGNFFEEVFLSAHDCTLQIEPAIEAEEFNLTVQNSTAAGQTSANDIDLTAAQGTITLVIQNPYSDYQIEAKANDGNILLNGTAIAGTDAGAVRACLGDESCPAELDMKADAGVIEITIPS
ncbi:MAG: hypothetical protein ACOYIE_05740 [Agathobaculum sp.]|jgi:hypothetical protein|uniref:hypothetical protein n=1 Tax=Agathobaculum sp. TaxID=2048138 RepID=UPI003D8AD5F0